MLKKNIVISFFLFLLLTYNLQAQAFLPFGKDDMPTLAPMLEKATPAVVNIATTTRVAGNQLLLDPFFQRFFEVPKQEENHSLGSGVILDADNGYIVTNNHVIDGADQIQITLSDGRKFKAKLIGRDKKADIAVIQIKADKLTALSFADSDKLRVGDFAVAIGNPYGLGQTVTSGIISALDRSGLGIEDYESFIQTDASINPGNSGGALIDLKGRLIGINTAILGPNGSNIGIGFAIPANVVKHLMKQLIQYGRIIRGHLGVAIQDLSTTLAQALNVPHNQGAVVTEVFSGSDAEKAGLKTGDVIIAINKSKITNAAKLVNKIGLIPVVEKMTIDIIRKGKQKRLYATISKPKQQQLDGGKLSWLLRGATFVNAADYQSDTSGVAVQQVKPGSTAWQSGLRRGDIIFALNRYKIRNLKELTTLFKQFNGTITLRFIRHNKIYQLILK